MSIHFLQIHSIIHQQERAHAVSYLQCSLFHELHKPISISLLSHSLFLFHRRCCPSLLSCVHLLIRLGHYIWGCWPNQCNKGSLRALLPISVIRLQLKGRLCRLCLITAARRRWASISQVGLLICLLPYEPAGLVGVSHHAGAIKAVFSGRAAVALHNDFISAIPFKFRMEKLNCSRNAVQNCLFILKQRE